MKRSWAAVAGHIFVGRGEEQKGGAAETQLGAMHAALVLPALYLLTAFSTALDICKYNIHFFTRILI